jgi:hypothetical protein
MDASRLYLQSRSSLLKPLILTVIGKCLPGTRFCRNYHKEYHLTKILRDILLETLRKYQPEERKMIPTSIGMTTKRSMTD